MPTNIQMLTGSSATLIMKDSRSTRFNVTLVGIYKNKYLLASYLGQEDGLKHVKANRQYLVQVKKDNVVHVFRACMEKVETGSFPLVHLVLGEEVLNTKRRVPRTSGNGTKIKLSLALSSADVDVEMADISTAGARLVANRRLGSVDDSFVINIRSQYGNEQFKVPCKVRHVSSDIDNNSRSSIVFHHGVEFVNIGEPVTEFLEQFVKEVLH